MISSPITYTPSNWPTGICLLILTVIDYRRIWQRLLTNIYVLFFLATELHYIFQLPLQLDTVTWLFSGQCNTMNRSDVDWFLPCSNPFKFPTHNHCSYSSVRGWMRMYLGICVRGRHKMEEACAPEVLMGVEPLPSIQHPQWSVIWVINFYFIKSLGSEE